MPLRTGARGTVFRSAPRPVTGPAALFEGGTYKGWWFDASDLSTLKQNAGGTTAVTADNDPVKYWASKAGGGGILSNASSGAIYDDVGGYGAVFFATETTDRLDSDSTLRTRVNGCSSYTTVIVADVDTPVGSPQWFLVDAGTNQSNLYTSGTSAQFFGAADPFIGTIFATDVRTKAVWTIERYADNTSPRIRASKNGVADGTGGSATTTPFSTVDANGIDMCRSPGHVYQWFWIDRILPAESLLQLQKDLGALAGVTI
jgi:hypothetical protein